MRGEDGGSHHHGDEGAPSRPPPCMESISKARVLLTHLPALDPHCCQGGASPPLPQTPPSRPLTIENIRARMLLIAPPSIVRLRKPRLL